jgi:pyridoxal 5'-phosphate synthase pdxS subunit
VGSGIFKSENPARRAKAIVESVNHFTDAMIIANASKSLGEAMPGLDVHLLTKEETLATRGR